jgi:hypothetical protein
MKELIRQILREYTEPKVTITEISPDSPLLKKILLEQEEDNNVFYDNEGNVVNINGVARELKNYFKLHYNFTPETPKVFCGRFNSKGCGLKFILNENDPFRNNHFVERIYRVTSGDYRPNGTKYNEKLVNPGKFEGLDLFFDNIEKITERIEESSKSIKGGRDPWAKTTSKSFYMLKLDNLFSIMFELEKNNVAGHGITYIVRFLTQLKGDEMNRTSELHKSIKIIF